MTTELKHNKTFLLGLIALVLIFLSIGTLATTTYSNQRVIVPNIYTANNVKFWGATGDGVTDDTAAIQATIDYALQGGSYGNRDGLIIFPPGNYRVSDTILIDGNKTGNQEGAVLNFVGTGHDWNTLSGNSSVFLNATFTTPMKPVVWFKNDTVNTKWDGISIVNGGIGILYNATPGQTGSHIISNKGNTVTRTIFSGQVNASIWVGYPLSDTTSDMDGDGFFFEKDSFGGAPTYNIVLNVAQNGHRAIIRDSYFYGSGTHAIYVPKWSGLLFENTFVYSSYSDYAINITGGGGYFVFRDSITEAAKYIHIFGLSGLSTGLNPTAEYSNLQINDAGSTYPIIWANQSGAPSNYMNNVNNKTYTASNRPVAYAFDVATWLNSVQVTLPAYVIADTALTAITPYNMYKTYAKPAGNQPLCIDNTGRIFTAAVC